MNLQIGLRRLAASWLLCLAGAVQASNAGAWFSPAGQPTAQASLAVELLARAGDDGLDPADYDAAALRQMLARAPASPWTAAEQAELAARLSGAMERFLADLHGGRVDPRAVHHNYRPAAGAAYDAAGVLSDALGRGRLAEAVREAAPPIVLYGSLRRVLALYRSLEGHGAWAAPLPAPAGGKLAPGQAYPGLARLADRLLAVGDLQPHAVLPGMYEGVLVEAVRSFQARHGLAPDGVVGAQTLTQLQVAPAQRVRQIELTMERLRWTPALRERRMVVINIPEFVLRAYETDGTQIAVQASMRVIVGRAARTRTPVFDEAMRFIEFSPYWNVPPSIARGELVPRLRRDPAHFQQQGFEFVTRDGKAVGTLSPAHLDAVMRGEMRIRQRPGPANALGGIKFVFPNSSNIYLHHTPATELFSQQRRDFSHGCIRVEDPMALARFVLQHDPAWDEARIRAAMDRGQSATLQLREPVRVLIAYATVLVKDGGRAHFFGDLYGHDEQLDRALRARPRPAAAVRRP